MDTQKQRRASHLRNQLRSNPFPDINDTIYVDIHNLEKLLGEIYYLEKTGGLSYSTALELCDCILNLEITLLEDKLKEGKEGINADTQ